MWLVLVLCVTVLVLALGADAKEICHPEVGCFNNDPPYDNAGGNLPLSPGQLPLKVLLYTRQHRDSSISVQYNDPDLRKTLNNALLDLDKDTKFVTHGFGGSAANSEWMLDIKEALLDKGDFNVLIVDWEEGAKMPDYFQAVANVRVVAAQIQILLEAMQKDGLDPSKAHLIGHSIGAHLFGEVGRRMNGSVGRITGLDAAAPLFEGRSSTVKLDQSDAMFVDVIHTDAGDQSLFTAGLAITEPAGHVDFYVNGGENQPGCYDNIFGTIGSWFGRKRGETVINFVGCSHQRAWELFLESISSDCAFTAYPCASYEKFEDGECRDCSNNVCNEMGYHADPGKGTGSLYLDTDSDSPYCEDEDTSGSWWDWFK